MRRFCCCSDSGSVREVDAAGKWTIGGAEPRGAARELDQLEGRNAYFVDLARRFVRIGFDLHDGPLQEIAALQSELSLFAEQLEKALRSHPHREIVLARVGDIEARLRALDHELRELAHSLRPKALLEQGFEVALTAAVDELERSSSIRGRLQLEGEPSSLTASQRLTLVQVVREALTNVRKHSGAREVAIRVRARRDRVTAEIVDDGRGLDVETEFARARREGRLGLIGMRERVRMLGGELEIESEPGAFTAVRLTLFT
jgi:signal transduction histidine kinase